ncbi:MAG: hypothetical protein LBG46_04260 [Elusimicrobiota bacterium]|nr:hypothetical protein [Elusimicrobiota bacterium]
MELDSGRKNKIIAISIVRNESRRYLREWLDKLIKSAQKMKSVIKDFWK